MPSDLSSVAQAEAVGAVASAAAAETSRPGETCVPSSACGLAVIRPSGIDPGIGSQAARTPATPMLERVQPRLRGAARQVSTTLQKKP